MTPEPARTLPLAEAVLGGLCGVRLAEAMREALVAVAELPADLPVDIDEQAGAHPAITPAAAAAHRHLAEVETALRRELGSRGRRGEFHLRGRRTAHEPVVGDEVIPPSSFGDLNFDLVANAVTVADVRYEHVHAVLGPAPPASEDVASARRLPLSEALASWCDSRILFEIRRREYYFSPAELRRLEHPNLGAAGEGSDSGRNPISRDHNLRRELEELWKDLEKDFKDRIRRGEVYLQGVQTYPELRSTPEHVPSAWASDMRFKFSDDVLNVHRYRFISVVCSLDPPTEVESGQHQETATPSSATARLVIRAEDVPSLDDETILALLEENHRRVVENDSETLFPPVKVSLMPLLRRKMRHRAKTGQIHGTLAAEAAELAAWIGTKLSSHHLPTPGTIENGLRKDYWDLNPRSKAMNP